MRVIPQRSKNRLEMKNEIVLKYTFTKYDATGNVFLLCRSRTSLFSGKRKAEYSAVARTMCAPLTGAGADGVLVLSPDKGVDFALDVFNADGSWAERSGNGLRAAAVFAQKEISRRRNWKISCGGAVITASVLEKTSPETWQVSTEVGYPEVERAKLNELVIGSKRIKYLPMTIGNPHAVIPVKSFPKDWVEIGRRISSSRRFRDGVNVEFVKVVNRRKIQIRIFERGVGPTGSSGTGASASVAAMRVLGKVSGNVTVDSFDLQSVKQRLNVIWSGSDEPVHVRGSVRELFTLQVKI